MQEYNSELLLPCGLQFLNKKNIIQSSYFPVAYNF